MKYLIASLLTILVCCVQAVPQPSFEEFLYQFPGVTEEHIEGYKIPKVLFKTGPTDTCQNNRELYALFEKNEEISGYKVIFFSDEKCREIIKMYFPERYLQAYDDILPGAYKADIFRLAVLYLAGGVYGDIAQEFLVDPTTYINHEETDFFCVQDPMYGTFAGTGIFNGFLASAPRSPLILFILDKIITDIENKRIPRNHLDITGPCACIRYYNAFFQFLNYRTPHFGYSRVLTGQDDKQYRVDVLWRLPADDLTRLRNSKGEEVLRLKIYPLYNQLFENKKKYTNYRKTELYATPRKTIVLDHYSFTKPATCS